ncbi:MAG TPA: sigma-70 family RNA polymerase sigma factor [Candidatus Dormibacteraeota bacterium]|nr:sigma-70 family RNA polymerase sigma factor [Candidatus Dormibacteraeota bacterium]
MSEWQLSAAMGARYNLDPMAISDVELMLGVKAGDEACFEQLLEKYRTPLVSFLYRMVRDQATAEDLAQEAFLRVFRARKSYAPDAKFTTWLFRIATNLALNSLRDGRRRQRELSIDSPEQGDQPLLDVADPGAAIEQKLVDRDRSRAIWQAVQELPEKQRAAVMLHKYQELGYDEIACILGCSESALKSLLFRAYQTLRGRLASLAPRAARAGKGEGR